MFALKLSKRWPALVASVALLAGCASNPAPVTNYSFGGSSAPPAPSSTVAQAPASSGVQTYGLGAHANEAGHANGTMGASGYTVAHGDTLYSIAFANGIDARQLAAINNIPPPYVIHPGQVLKLKPSASGNIATGTPVANSATPAPVPTTAQPAAQPPAATPSSAPVFGPVTSQSMTGNGVAPAEPESVVTAPEPEPSVPSATTAAGVAQPPVAQPSVPTPAPGGTRNVGGIAWQWPASGKMIGGFQAGGGGDGAGLNIAGNMGDPVRAAASGTVVYSGNGLIGYGELIIIKHNDTFLSAYGHNSKRLVKEGDRVSAGQEIALMGASGAPRVELHFEIRKDGKPVDPLGYLPGR